MVIEKPHMNFIILRLQIFQSRILLYLHNILTRSEGELVKPLYTAQRNNPSRQDFIELVKQNFHNVCEPCAEETIKLEN